VGLGLSGVSPRDEALVLDPLVDCRGADGLTHRLPLGRVDRFSARVGDGAW
jgi:hypothetical protein